MIFSCSAYAIPVINITWTYFTLDGVAQVLSNTVERIDIAQEREEFITTSTLMISNATFADRGVFMCDAGNEHGDIFANASLTVFGELPISLKKKLHACHRNSIYKLASCFSI